MAKLITVQRAKDEIKKLQKYITLAEDYEATTSEKLIIKEYAYTNSIAKVIEILNERGIKKDDKPINKQDVVAVINSKASDDLHKSIKSGYLFRTKHSRSKKRTPY